jgi:DNA processing protein
MDAPLDIDDANDALLRLVLAGGALAPRRGLLEASGDPRAALQAGPPAWRMHGLDAAQCRALHEAHAVVLARCHAWLREPRHALLGIHDPDYPPLLRRIAGSPLALFVDGDASTLWHPSIAVVGSRSPTAGGRDNAEALSRALGTAGFSIASGMAAGIDTAAHIAALEGNGPTVAVLGTGIDVPYPRANTTLFARIAERGAVVSEYAPGTPARREQFPSRNRILAGLALGTLVVEAAPRSGALITARCAAEAGREVFAIPGSIHNPLARGCHRLIRDGAALVEDASEVIAALAPMAAELAEALRGRLRAGVAPPSLIGTSGPAAAGDRDSAHDTLWKALGHDPTPMEHLVLRTGLTTAELSSILLLMELDGRVVVEHGRYSRNRR